MAEWTDLHSHLIPGVDDGARDPEESREALRAMAAEGVQSLATTPHVDGSITTDPAALRRRMDELDQGWARLQEALGDEGLPRVQRGAEVRLDIPEVDISDPRLRLGGTNSVLVEFPFMQIPPRAEQVLGEIRAQDYLPLLAHPERYRGTRLEGVERWLDAGAFLQVNAPALEGRYGDRARDLAWELLHRGWVHCLSSDYHARGEPRLSAIRTTLEEAEGREQAELLFETNPARLLQGQQPLPVEPLPKTSWWGKLRRTFS